MKLEQIWGRVARHLLKQNAKSAEPTPPEPGTPAGTLCLYRGPNGMKCAVGCLIDDRFYKPSLENKTVVTLPVKSALAHSLGIVVSDSEIYLLSLLQRVHDYKVPALWPSALVSVAKEMGLDPELCLAELQA